MRAPVDAKQSRGNAKELDCFVARAPRNDGGEFSTILSTSLRAHAKQSSETPKNWIASSQELLAMTGRVFHYPLNVIASACEANQRNAKELDCFRLRSSSFGGRGRRKSSSQ
jgi:hypothetical protein